VEILDEQGNTAITLTTNSAGNFYTKKALPNPYRARITAPDGTVREMEDSTDNGNCSHCHRVPGLDDAKGRIAVELTTSANMESAASDGS
jgi:hypothetical protein